MHLVEANDAGDHRLDDFRDLTDADVRPDRRGIVIAEGANVVQRLIESPYPLRAVIGVRSRIEALRPLLDPLDVPVFVVDKWTLSSIVGFRVTRGVLASGDRMPSPQASALLASAQRVAVLEALNDFENLGALFRNAAAFGVDAVMLSPQCADPLYRRSVRVSMGHVLRVPFAVLPEPWPSSLDIVRQNGLTTLALTPTGEQTLAALDLPDRWAVLLGAEGPGLTDEVMARADVRVRIPMASGVDSLNVATAAAVAFARLTGAS